MLWPLKVNEAHRITPPKRRIVRKAGRDAGYVEEQKVGEQRRQTREETWIRQWKDEQWQYMDGSNDLMQLQVIPKGSRCNLMTEFKKVEYFFFKN
jgi:hypothetical protein